MADVSRPLKSDDAEVLDFIANEDGAASSKLNSIAQTRFSLAFSEIRGSTMEKFTTAGARP